MTAATKLQDSLPNLPGYKARLPLASGDRKHYRKTTLKYLRGYALDEPPVPADVLPTDLAPPTESSAAEDGSGEVQSKAKENVPYGQGSPKWLEKDKQVLRWTGYFKEAVPESPHENHRVRQVAICYYLSDDTLEVLEPRTKNSGLWQGTFLKRHRVAKPDGQPYTEKDIRVGENVCMYARVFRIVDADQFTRNHFLQQGIALAPAEQIPVDPHSMSETLKSQQKDQEATTRKEDANSGLLQQGRFQAYLLNSKKVLRFYCVWDDRQRMYGDRRPLRLHFYLEDSTVEILEDYEQNSGREHFPVFLHRSQLPKDPHLVKGSRNVDKSLCFGVEDFRIGSTIFVYGRNLFVYDCDEFTRSWFQEYLAYPAESMAAVNIKEPLPEHKSRVLPPYNGYGSLADSAENCKHLIPQPPKKDFYKLINQGSIVLRFGASFLGSPAHPISEDHQDRQFVVSFFMADDSISIFETPTDGFPGGKFLERGQVPAGRKDSEQIITDLDLYVGAKLAIYKHAFLLDSADEYTLQYMENKCQKYLMANWESAVEAVKSQISDGGDRLRASLVEVGSTAEDSYKSSTLMAALARAGANVSKHQAISIYRHLCKGSLTSSFAAQALLDLLEC